MKRVIIPAVVLITVFIVTGGFFLPNYVSGVKDRQTIGQLDITDGGSISFETKSELGIIDRLKMITSAPSVALDNGKNMNADMAFETALLELGKFNIQDVIELDLTTFQMIKCDVAFFIDSADPTKNMIVWTLLLENDKYDIVVSVDDETGKLLSLQCSMNVKFYRKEAAVIKSITIEPLDMELIGQTVADYYGLTYVQSKPKKYDEDFQVSFILSDGQDTIAIEVIITAFGFFVNF